jgi:hypothetical protein
MLRQLNLRSLTLILALLIGTAYIPSVTGSFHFDDFHTIPDNPAMRNPHSLIDVWTDTTVDSVLAANRSYRPLLFINFFTCWQVGSGATWPFHVTKMFMHLAYCLALFTMWRRLYALPGWLPKGLPEIKAPWMKTAVPLDPDLVAMLFAMVVAIHPACGECVNYIAASSSLQCALFYVLGFCAYLIHRERRPKKLLSPVVIAGLVSYAAAVLSKEEGITLPAVIVLFELPPIS